MLGTGGSINATLSDGIHVVSATSTDAEGGIGRDLVTLIVGQPMLLSSYSHNALGQRVIKTLEATNNTIHFIYDPEGRVIAEIDTATGDTLREYIYVNGQQVALVDGTQTANETMYFVHNDHLGTPQRITDASQSIVWAADYEPFGKADVTINTIGNNVRYPGQYQDGETGLHYNYFRDYDPTTGRYLESDPIGLGGGFNTYTYVENNPYLYTDSTGQFFDAIIDIAFISYDVYRLVKDNLLNECENLGENLAALGADFAGLAIPGATGLGAASRVARRSDDVINVVKRGEEGLNLYKKGHEFTSKAKGWRDGDFMLHLPNKGSPKANWRQNSGRLREQMNARKPIYDSYIDPKTGKQIPAGQGIKDPGRFLNAERKLLESRGWQYNLGTGAYHPPN